MISMDPETERIFEVVKANVVKVLTGIDPATVTLERSLTELGANSVDRVEVVLYAVEDLGLDVPRAELHGARNLADLVAVLRRHAGR